MHAREAVPLTTLAIIAGIAAIGIWLANFIIPGFSGPPWQTVVSVVAVAVVVGVIGRPSAQREPHPSPERTAPDPEPQSPPQSAADEGLAGGTAAQPAFRPQHAAYVSSVVADRKMDSTTPL